MAGFCRHAVDDASPAARFCLLAICLAVSGLLHGLVLLVPWSTLGGFSLLGPAAQRRPGHPSRPIVEGKPARLQIDFAVARLPVAADPPKEQVVRPAAALPRPLPQIAAEPAPERAPSPDPAVAHAPPGVAEEAAPAEPEGRTVPLPQYFPAEKLTRQPELAEEIDHTLSESLEPGFRGRVVIRLFLDETGKPNKVRVMESSLPLEIEGLVVTTFFRARYRPGEIDGQPVMSEMTVAVDLSTVFELPLPASPPGGKPDDKSRTGRP